MPEIATTPPSEIRAGDTVKFTVTSADYPLSDGWALSYVLNGPVKLTGTVGTPSGNSAEVSLTAAQTATLTAGTYTWVLRVTKSGETYTIGSGRTTVTPDVSAALAGTLTSKAEQTLAYIEAELQARAQSDHTEYSVDGFALKRESITDLHEWRDKLRAEIWRARRGGKISTVSVQFVGTGAAK